VLEQYKFNVAVIAVNVWTWEKHWHNVEKNVKSYARVYSFDMAKHLHPSLLFADKAEAHLTSKH